MLKGIFAVGLLSLLALGTPVNASPEPSPAGLVQESDPCQWAAQQITGTTTLKMLCPRGKRSGVEVCSWVVVTPNAGFFCSACFVQADPTRQFRCSYVYSSNCRGTMSTFQGTCKRNPPGGCGTPPSGTSGMVDMPTAIMGYCQ